MSALGGKRTLGFVGAGDSSPTVEASPPRRRHSSSASRPRLSCLAGGLGGSLIRRRPFLQQRRSWLCPLDWRPSMRQEHCHTGCSAPLRQPHRQPRLVLLPLPDFRQAPDRHQACNPLPVSLLPSIGPLEFPGRSRGRPITRSTLATCSTATSGRFAAVASC